MQWTRSLVTEGASGAYCFEKNGAPWYGNCTILAGFRPAFILPSILYVSNDGSVSFNIPPTIASGTANGSNLGNKTVGFNCTYSINDADGDTVTVKEYLNAWVETVRAKYLNEYRQGGLDMDLLLSDAILLRERDYFISRVHEDIDATMEGIREAHRGRSESGPDHSAIAEFKRDLEDVANFKGSHAEAWLMMYCKQTKTPLS